MDDTETPERKEVAVLSCYRRVNGNVCRLGFALQNAEVRPGATGPMIEIPFDQLLVVASAINCLHASMQQYGDMVVVADPTRWTPYITRTIDLARKLADDPLSTHIRGMLCDSLRDLDKDVETAKAAYAATPGMQSKET